MPTSGRADHLLVSQLRFRIMSDVVYLVDVDISMIRRLFTGGQRKVVALGQ